MEVRRWEWLCLGCILCIALVLRSINLNSGLWYDEIVTLVTYVRLPTYDLITTYSSLNNHILYSLTAQATVAVFGESAWAVRLPAMLFGVASVAALWWLARQVVGRSEAILCALLMTCSYHHIWFSQNARGYTGLLLCTLLATGLFLKGVNSTSRKPWVVYAIVFVLAMYMHLSAVFVFIVHVLVYAIMLIKRRFQRYRGGRSLLETNGTPVWHPMFGFLLGGIMTLLLYAILVPQMIEAFSEASGTPAHSGFSESKNPIWTILETARSFRSEGLAFTIGLPVVGVLSALGIIDLWRRNNVFALLAIVHVPLTLTILYATSFRIWPRYFFVDAGFAILFLVHGTFVASCTFVDRFGLSRHFLLTGKWAGVVVTTIFIIGSLFMLPQNYRLPKQDFQGARDYVEAARSPDDLVASLGHASLAFRKFYAPDWEVVETRQQLDQLRARSEITWLVYSFPQHTTAKYPDVMASTAVDFELANTFPGTLGEGTVLVFRSRKR